MKAKIFLSAFYLLCTSAVYSNNAAQNAPQDAYESSPKLFEKEPPEDIYDVKKGLYIGPTASFGRSFSTGSESSTTAYTYGLHTNYTKKIGPWSLLQVSGEFFRGHLGHADADIDVKYGFKIKLGYGYNIKPGLYGVWHVGALLAGADYKDSLQRETRNTILGNGLLGEFSLRYAASSMVSLIGGIEFSFHSYNVKNVYNTKLAVSEDYRKNIGLMTLQAKLGLDIQVF